MELFKLLGTIVINNGEANDGIDETTEKASKSEGKISSAFKKIGTAIVTYIAVDRIAAFGQACLDSAANAQAMESQFSQVFGDLEGQASESLSKMAAEAGITENRMKGSYTKIAAFAKTTGMETADALSLADRAMVAVADSAAFYDRSLEDTTESLQSFLKGNFENDAALGLSCTETTRNAAANELYGKSFIELSESQKQLTLLKMVEDANKLSGAMGQASRESDTWTNQTGNLRQAWTDFTANIGERFLPVAINVVKWLSEKMPQVEAFVVGAMDKIGVVIAALEPIARTLFEHISTLWVTVLQPCFVEIGRFIEQVLAPTFKFVFENIIEPVVGDVFERIGWLWNNILKPIFTGITDFLSGVFTGNWREAFSGIVSIIRGIWNGIIEVVKSPINSVIWLINSFIGGLNQLKIPDWVPGLGGVGINIPFIPYLEKGGILEKGQVGFLEGNGAEAVVPLDQNRAWISKVAADLNEMQGNGNGAALADAIVDKLDDLLDAITGLKVYLNTGTLVGELAPAIDRSLGDMTRLRGRGQ